MDILQSIIRVDLDQLPFLLITILIAFTVHEFSHAYFANKFGDPTARLLGRMTLNPAVHFDFWYFTAAGCWFRVGTSSSCKP